MGMVLPSTVTLDLFGVVAIAIPVDTHAVYSIALSLLIAVLRLERASTHY